MAKGDRLRTRRNEEKMKKRVRYKSDLPRLMYTYFIGYSEGGAPSFDKFARSVGLTLSELEEFKSHSEFLRAWRECSEIRRDYLIDTALAKRADASLVKFLLTAEYGMREPVAAEESTVSVTVEVVE